MDVFPLLGRCIAIERMAGEIYDILADRVEDDTELRHFWRAMADDERLHASKLEELSQLTAVYGSERRSVIEDFEKEVGEIERLVVDAKDEAKQVDNADDAFAIALEIEMSELDLIYTTLLQRSPLPLCTEIEKTRRSEMAGHHEALVRAVRARSRNEQNLVRAALLAAED